MKPRSPAVALAVAVVVAVLAGCGSGGTTRPAAVVDGTPITQQQIVDVLEAVAGNDQFVAARDPNQNPIFGQEPGTFDSAYVAEVLTEKIFYTVIHNELVRRELTVDDACRQVARSAVVGRLAASSPGSDGESVLDAFGAEYSAVLVEEEAEVRTVAGDLVGRSCADLEEPEAYFRQHAEEFGGEVACVSHILLPTREAADEVALLLAGGADFVETALSRSTDPSVSQNGGDLGCVTRDTSFVQPFLEAAFAQEVGVVGPPVETEFGFHLILVTRRGEASFEDVRDQVQQAMGEELQFEFREFITNALNSADVDVDDRYGTWNPETSTIDRPPSGPTGDQTSTTVPAGAPPAP